MSVSTLKLAIEQAYDDLKAVKETVAKVAGGSTLGRESNDFFASAAQLGTQIDQAKNLLAVREQAFTAVLSFPSQQSKANPGLFDYNGLHVDFKVGRYLLLQNYPVVTWAMYDSLSKVSGLLCCTEEWVKNPSKPVKLYEDFLQGKNSVGARVRDHLRGAYGWPIAVSYKIRNWLAHDGHCHDTVEMFKYDSPVAASEFEMLDQAWQIVEDSCKMPPTSTRLLPFPNVKADLARGLEACNKEVDEAVAFLLSWSCGIAKLQASILYRRDLSVVSGVGSSPPAAAATVPAPSMTPAAVAPVAEPASFKPDPEVAAS